MSQQGYVEVLLDKFNMVDSNPVSTPEVIGQVLKPSKLNQALVQSFCDKSGFRLNVDKTQILTFAPLSPAIASMAVTSEAPTKSLGILVAPNLSPRARFNYVFERFVSRLSLW
ncbi:Aste57867_4943 [Aphanomyces stellatus]|uniref:Aste57867_4943 protein n=1 Tax=Aphanomyces stellatus TaxID=120398 RepID=A0A485KCK2_9STRA|nr:hypothetical protein As57867_004930 [Aphanomyces stellatus]VFT82031.1 Aste57867_4943 [Aphanomyces stellatus]